MARMSRRSFEDVVLPHLDAAFNYARWLTRSEEDARDVVQDACVRALRFFASLRSEDARAWLLTIVRHAWYARLSASGRTEARVVYDEGTDGRADAALDPEKLAMQQQTIARVREAIEQLPVDFREVLVLREIEGLAYKDIAAVVGVPIGTVMSRLARARERLLGVVTASDLQEAKS
jgi:RNA polymerase sigma factor (sigma-70 family)